MHWIKFFQYEWVKKRSRKWLLMNLGINLIWLCLLLYFSQLWGPSLERALDARYLITYYKEQSSYIAYLLIGFNIIRHSLDWMGEKHVFLEVMFGPQYLFCKCVLFLVETLWSVCWYFLWIQVFYVYAFNDFTFLIDIWIKLAVNACVFSGYVVLWNRIKSNLSMVFGLLLLVLHPNLNHISIRWVDFQIILPFMTNHFPKHAIGLVMLYYWLGFQMSLLKSK
ncbi:hypothetical protein N7603_04425 [Acholeplasma vituli]|uniref:Uncharacterized protein n=1 Tax=Paracholeplasma vituli TaxID=69473 RepID=A0ABT2PWT8_9MOLU|nr:hypothetical protein [Paracholeplasma vituli]MCU0104896.1 hypothetical protein [Paracholeplasma vituli]